MSWHNWTQLQLDEIRSANRWRELRAFDCNGVSGTVDGRSVIAFASNDYLGLSQNPQVKIAAHEAIERLGAGAAASRLVTGTRELHQQLESNIAEWKRCDRAIVFPNGYAANIGVLTVFGDADTTIFSDELNHASIIDGCRLAKANTKIYRHRDTNHLEQLLRASHTKKIIVTDLVFSMDGDIAPLDDLIDLCARHDALLILDEAHAAFDLQFNDKGVAILHMGTLSKMLGSLGGWIAGQKSMIDLVINRARTFIFTTGLSPADASAASQALAIYRSDEGAQLRARLRHNIDRLMEHHPSPIIPWILGDDRAALDASAALFSRGIHVPAIRPPTVPAGTARLRIALSALHTDEMIDNLIAALAETPQREIACT